MTKPVHIIRLPEVISSEFVSALKNGDVKVEGIGTFHLSPYKKEFHATIISSSKGKKQYAYLKGKTLVRINFKPHPDLKKAVKRPRK